MLAHSSVAERRQGDAWLQRPAGDPEVLSRVEAAGRRARFRLRIPVDRRAGPEDAPRRYGVILDVWSGAAGVPGPVELAGEEDLEFLALFRD